MVSLASRSREEEEEEREAELNVSLSFRSPLLPSGEAATAKVIRDKVVALNIQIGNLW